MARVTHLLDTSAILTPSRLPLVDACIAACAGKHHCVLVHRDPHMDALPRAAVRQMRLPDKG